MGTPPWIAALGVAGDRIRWLLFRPQLRVALENPRGERTIETIYKAPAEPDYTRPARYYRLAASNARRWSVAHDVRILITRLEMPDASGLPTSVWTGEIPLAWLHGQVYPASRNLGRPASADFVIVTQDLHVSQNQHQLHLMPVILPNNFQRSYYSAMHIWVTVVATSIETDSPPLRLALDWDGAWEEGEAEMARHFKIGPA